MKILAGVITVILCCGAMFAKPRGPLIKRSQCGNGLQELKTWSDKQRFKVNAENRVTTTGIVNVLPAPGQQPRSRKTNWQKRVWLVKAQIVEYRIDHGELRMVLYLDDRYLNAVIPSPACLRSKTRQRSRIEAVWNLFIARCGIPSPVEWKPLGAVVYISGVGFWSNKHLHRRGQAKNGAELHPVNSISLIAGCGT
jgi:hypothetical protein